MTVCLLIRIFLCYKGDMKKRLAIFISLILLLSILTVPTPTAAFDDYGRTVRVRLSVGNISSINIDVTGTYTVAGTSFTGGRLTATLLSSGNVKLEHSSLGTLTTAKEVYIQRQYADKDSAYLKLAVSSGSVRTYLGDMNLFKDSSDNILRVVNHVDMHDYLYGAVSGEVSESSHVELLRTQTIAAKCFALVEANAHTSWTFDVYDTTTSQLYIGYVASDVRTIAAVDEVWQQTLLYEGNVVKTHYGTANGGVILTPKMKWGGSSNYEGAYQLKYDPFDLLRTSSNLVIRINGETPSTLPDGLYSAMLNAAKANVSSATSIYSIDAMSGFFTYGAGSYSAPTTFTVQLTVSSSSGSKYSTEITLNFDTLQSSGVVSASGEVHFVSQVGLKNWHLVYGIPSGPRVGMSHQGAKKMAEYGYSYVDILKYYYPNATLTDPDGSVVPSTADTSIAGVVKAIYGEIVLEGSFYGYVNISSASLMSAPESNSVNLYQLSAKAPIIVLDKAGDWYYVKDIQSGLFGYLYISYVAPFTKFVYVNDDDTNFRQGPGTEYGVITVVNTYEQLAVYGESGNWYQAAILNTGTVGYIYKSLCNAMSTITPPTIPTPTPTAVPTPTASPTPTPTPTPRPTPTIDYGIIPQTLGDVNGDGVVNAADASSMLRYVVKLERYSNLQTEAGDLNADGYVNAADASRILRYLVHLESQLASNG